MEERSRRKERDQRSGGLTDSGYTLVELVAGGALLLLASLLLVRGMTLADRLYREGGALRERTEAVERRAAYRLEEGKAERMEIAVEIGSQTILWEVGKGSDGSGVVWIGGE